MFLLLKLTDLTRLNANICKDSLKFVTTNHLKLGLRPFKKLERPQDQRKSSGSPQDQRKSSDSFNERKTCRQVCKHSTNLKFSIMLILLLTHTHQKMLQLDFSHTEKELKVDWLNQATEHKLDANRTSWLPSRKKAASWRAKCLPQLGGPGVSRQLQTFKSW